MNKIIFFLLICFTGNLQAQVECQIAYISDHYVLNNTDDTVAIWVNIRDQERFRSDGCEKYDIEPGARVKVSDLEWAGEFRDPTLWFVFKVDPRGLTPMCDKKNWLFEQLSETKGEYCLTLETTSEEPCEVLDEELYFTDGKQIEVESEEEIYDFIEIEPQFPGGVEAMFNWMNKKNIYPQEAIINGISGRVYVEFVVEKTGAISNIKILRSPHELLSQEGIRLVESMPNWEPGKVNNQDVRARYTLPISFVLYDD